MAVDGAATRSLTERCGRGCVKTAIFGGTFNPIHNGHLHLVASVCVELRYEQVIFVPAHLPPHKDVDELIAGYHRLAMVRLAIAGQAAWSVDVCELDRGGISYTIETVRYLGANRSKLGLIIGDDLVEDFRSWRQALELSRETDLILGLRGECAVPLHFPHQLVRNVQLPLSSQLIRERLRSGLSVDHLMPPAVLDYIRANRLYRVG